MTFYLNLGDFDFCDPSTRQAALRSARDKWPMEQVRCSRQLCNWTNIAFNIEQIMAFRTNIVVISIKYRTNIVSELAFITSIVSFGIEC